MRPGPSCRLCPEVKRRTVEALEQDKRPKPLKGLGVARLFLVARLFAVKNNPKKNFHLGWFLQKETLIE